MSRWAAFLDRDGTINEEVGLVSDPSQLRLIEGAADAVERLRKAGAYVAVITNQSVVARGLIDEPGLGLVHERLKSLLADSGTKVDEILYCPHHPERGHPEADDPVYRRDCECRKPKPGMILDSARRNGIDLGSSFMVGDSTRDIGAGAAAGCRTILLKTGFAGSDGVCSDVEPDAEETDLSAAAERILTWREAS